MTLRNDFYLPSIHSTVLKGDCYSEKWFLVCVNLLVAFAVGSSCSNGGNNTECSTSVGKTVRFLSLRGFSHLGGQVECWWLFTNYFIPFVCASSALIVKWIAEVPRAVRGSQVILTIAAHSVQSENRRLPVACSNIELPKADTFSWFTLVT